MTQEADTGTAEVRITALSPARVAELLRRSGARQATADTVQADIAAGAPVNADGTVNLIHYAAWLVKELAAHGH